MLGNWEDEWLRGMFDNAAELRKGRGRVFVKLQRDGSPADLYVVTGVRPEIRADRYEWAGDAWRRVKTGIRFSLAGQKGKVSATIDAPKGRLVAA